MSNAVNTIYFDLTAIRQAIDVDYNPMSVNFAVFERDIKVLEDFSYLCSRTLHVLVQLMGLLQPLIHNYSADWDNLFLKLDNHTSAMNQAMNLLVDGPRRMPVAGEEAAGELMLTLSEEQRIHVKGKEDDPTAMWDALQAVHQQKIPGTRFNAFDDFFALRKRPEESLSSLIARVDTLCQDQGPSPSCLHSGLSGPGSTLDKDAVVQAFIQEENNRTRRSTAPVASSEAVLAVSAPSSGSAPSLDHCTCTGELLCSFCEKPHHCFHKCFALRRAKNELKAQSSSRKPDNQSGRSQRANQAQAAPSAPGTSSTAPVPPSASQAVVEYAGNASLCSSPSPTSPTCPLQLDADADWIADTGATSHMTPHRHWLRSYTPMRMPLRLADHTVCGVCGGLS
ncbi:hypothetical protein CONPUDRAFT_158795 [Coniophora puteana RWD-64-598 SS2]|uniref:Retrovirus-related Pol polyprotein from transposon TNT 1-94-like beta-barrel domain-containing protein n=1 Tax=Coniophora puteana (strain RWD-64-598) TaxID=741705 RepID=A0A5M3M9Z7_CONPW|nr:uncharacterized protein CONPUDRAFT_158795 [Coniophora puteana RWD-64-598 SS2]EIW76019.1 hypothetical protein CONPUDRAFT_158795 [Coniophora puteana RWD-64-598 SS2]